LKSREEEREKLIQKWDGEKEEIIKVWEKEKDKLRKQVCSRQT
jgi:hypothetical protein